ncbi:MAG: putative DNA binding domain-containing protein [Candidatus Kapabacteria bacterium]|nr:putative DNA binding domain-containing protein [Candidatus Kapabacteria bacterium]
MNNNKQIAIDFLTEFIRIISAESSLVLNFTMMKAIEIVLKDSLEINNISDFQTLSNKKFDFIIGDLPFCHNSVLIDKNSKLKVSKHWSYLLDSLRALNSSGKAFFLVEPSLLFSILGKKFLKFLNSENYFLTTAFELPEKVLYPETGLQSIMLGFETIQNDNLFIGEITSNFSLLIQNYINKFDSAFLKNGILVKSDTFESFHKFRIEQEIQNLQTQYKDFTKYKLSEVSIEINLTKTVFQNKANSVYIPKIGTSPVISELEKTTLKHHNYFQVVLNNEIVEAKYVELFYQTVLGKLILQSNTFGSFIPNINKTDIISSVIAIPNLSEQKLLVLTNQKLSELQAIISQLKKELSLNPKNAEIILDKFESIKSPLKLLSDEDRILSLIRKGENKRIEFKETFSKDLKTGAKNKDIEKSSLKNIAGFLNSEGGTLLIGVSDGGNVNGIENDLFKNRDDYKKHFKDVLKAKIGEEFYNFIDFDIFLVNGKQILKAECKPSTIPCFYEGVEFYVRTTPATDQLSGKKQFEYIKTRFN